MASSINSLLLTEQLGERSEVCAKHGSFQSKGMRIKTGAGRELWTSCPGCKADQDVEAKRLLDDANAKAKADRLENILKQVSIPARFKDATLDSFEVKTDAQRAIVDSCRRYVDGFDGNLKRGSSLIFSGAMGTGKTHLAISILKAIMPRHVGAYMTLTDMFKAIRETWSKGSAKRESEVIEELAGLPLLVLDEIGVQYGSDAEQILLFDVMDRRYRDCKPTIMVTNQNQAGFKQIVGDRIYDRLRQSGHWMSFDWESIRKRLREDV